MPPSPKAISTPTDIVHVNAHATSTPVGDVAEAKALRAALGDAVDGIAVSATKSMTGHLLGAAGALEGIFSILALHHRVAPPTINVDDLDREVPLDVVRKEPRSLADRGHRGAQQLVRFRWPQRGRGLPQRLTRRSASGSDADVIAGRSPCGPISEPACLKRNRSVLSFWRYGTVSLSSQVLLAGPSWRAIPKAGRNAGLAGHPEGR